MLYSKTGSRGELSLRCEPQCVTPATNQTPVVQSTALSSGREWHVAGQMLLRRSIRTVVILCLIAGCSSKHDDPSGGPGNGKTPAIAASNGRQAADVPRWKAPDDGDHFVGQKSCAECHAEISNSYRSHAMSISMAPVAHVTRAIEDYTNEVTFSSRPGMQYQVTRDGTQVLHHEQLLDATDNVVYDHAVEMHYAIGSGVHGRSYVHNRRGLLFMSPITWYSGSGRWDLSPGYQADDHPRFERRLSDDCVACHVGRANPVPGKSHRFQQEPFLEHSIGCERCHGPGRRHIAFHSSGSKTNTTSVPAADPIINPAGLEASLRESVCNQCHLQGIQRVLRQGRTPFDFRPGMHINEIWTTFVAGTQIDGESTEIVSQVQQMQSSRCYAASDGAFGCTSCHDPHSSPTDNRTEFYRTACLKCHQSPQVECAASLNERIQVTEQDSCIECHMPRLPSNVPHTANTDHRVQRRPSVISDAARNPGSVSPQPAVFEPESGHVTEHELRRARGLMMAQQAQDSGNPATAMDAVVQLNRLPDALRNDISVLDAVANALLIAGYMDGALSNWEKVLSMQPDHESALLGLSVIAVRMQNYDGAAVYLKRLTAVNDWESTTLGQSALILGKLGRMDEAIRDARLGLERNPGAVGIHDWLANAYQAQGDVAKSRFHVEQAKRIRAAIRQK